MSYTKTLFLLSSLAFLFFLNTQLDRILPDPHRIMVMGTERSGVTPLYASIKKSLKGNTNSFFEPTEEEFSRAVTSKARNVIVKINLADRHEYQNLDDSFQYFDHVIFVARDPRDILVSSLLAGVQNMDFTESPHLRKTFLDKLRAKEARPQTISLLDLFQLRSQLEREISDVSNITTRTYSHVINDIEAALRLIEGNEQVFVIHYEDFVDGKVENLEKMMRTDIQVNVDVMALEHVKGVRKNLEFISRSHAYGNWKNWMTPSDIVFFKPLLGDLLIKLGYKDDWTLNAEPKIDAESSSQYIENMIESKSITK